VRAARALEKTVGENKESERKVGIIVPIASGRKETKFHRDQKSRMSSSMNTKRLN
jgi:hypothetical protein